MLKPNRHHPGRHKTTPLTSEKSGWPMTPHIREEEINLCLHCTKITCTKGTCEKIRRRRDVLIEQTLDREDEK